LGRGSARPVAAFIVEPIRGKAANIPANRYLKSAADLCLRFGTLFIADEVQTSKGRTGRFLAVEHWGVEPDIVLLAKTFWRTRASPSRSGPQEYI
jgi:ornithine--oxo-acid transaminase